MFYEVFSLIQVLDVKELGSWRLRKFSIFENKNPKWPKITIF
jgi:hypothetical protein